MGLEGDISHFSLPDIIQLIGMGKRTGMLSLKKENDEGIIYFHDGQPVHALYNNLKGEEAAYSLFHWNQGNFKFENNIPSPSETITVNWMNLIMEGARHVDELEKIKTKIPSLNIIYEVAEDINKENSNINLSPKEWNVLSLIDGNRTCRDIIEKTGYGELETLKVMYELLSASLIIKRKLKVEVPFKEDEIKNKMVTILLDCLGKDAKNVEKKINSTKLNNKDEFYDLCNKIEKFIFLFVDSNKSKEIKDKLLDIIPKSE
ncbi:MAG: DUF4388 domain-containing protein [Candidatus Firestonebacteria bacterium]|nr:DUF4388 domain-containing protein [Candidatus Firestonebacteria bacterium]